MGDTVVVPVEDLRTRCADALTAAGATEAQAAALARASVEAESHGRRTVGVAHLLDYLDGFRAGRIAAVQPEFRAGSAVLAHVDCRGGVAHDGFEAALPWLTEASRTYGLAALCLSDCFTVGELGHYARLLTERGLIGLAFANSPALMSVAGSRGPMLGTNPLAFAVPLPDDATLAVDQASSATAWVTVREAAEGGQPLRDGVAVDGEGRPTDSAEAAMAGALLPFGGYKGGNIALLVELLAVLAGGTFSCAAPAFDRGDRSPSVGLFVLALSPSHFGGSFPERVAGQLRHWQHEHGAATERWTTPRETAQSVAVEASVLERLSRSATASADPDRHQAVS